MPLCPKCKFLWNATTRSSQQNRAYFGLVVDRLAQECNTTKEAMHEALVTEFLGTTVVKMPNGKFTKVPRSTKELSTVEFMNYIEKIQRYAAENGIDIPNPGEENDRDK